MKIKEVNSILKDKNSQNLNCNFKVTGKSRGSKLDLILQRLDKIDEFIVEQKQFNNFVLDQLKKHTLMLENIDKRIDNLISKNNLKE